MSAHIGQICRLTATIALLATCLLQVNAAEPPSDADAIQPEGHIELLFPADSSEEISGFFDHAGSLMHFQSYRNTVAKVTPNKVTVYLEVNDVIIDHEFEYAAYPMMTICAMTMNGHGAMLYPEHVQALRAFYPVLENALDERFLSDLFQRNTTREVRRARVADALYRVAMMYSEVPAGTVLDERKVTPDFDLNMYEKPALGDNASPLPQASCQVNDGDGVRRYPGAVCTELRVARQDHDARSHCLTGTDEYIGCKESNCKARCGAGCGRGGRGIYTKDCNDHDYCVYYHPEGGNPSNPSHNDCGDEWFDAVNDFEAPFPLWQCRGACR